MEFMAPSNQPMEMHKEIGNFGNSVEVRVTKKYKENCCKSMQKACESEEDTQKITSSPKPPPPSPPAKVAVVPPISDALPKPALGVVTSPSKSH